MTLMRTKQLIVIQESNLSVAWSRALVSVMDEPSMRGRPMLLMIAGSCAESPEEDSAVRGALDKQLNENARMSCDVTAMTIFPYEVWLRRGKPSCAEFSDLCVNRLLPRMRSRNTKNRYGTYFGRMMSFSGCAGNRTKRVNQLQIVIDLLNKNKAKNPRESALQISLFDPAKDHTGQSVRGFPCLQQISIFLTEDGSFGINAFYPVQYIFDRAYGNYLGLCHLGSFIAHQTQRHFAGLNCFVGRPLLGSISKGKMQSVSEHARRAAGLALEKERT